MLILKYIVLFLLSFTYLFAQIDLNSATSDELLELNGIGKTKSQKIINYREINGCFQSIDELANIDGISKNIIANNRAELFLGSCKEVDGKLIPSTSSLVNVLKDPINIFFVIIIFILGYLDYSTGRDLKSQIVSIGVLGTFVGIFIGLQAFNPEDIANSVNDILLGLKTAFFTSIVGMSVSTTLSIFQKFQGKETDE
jgi:competence ComEA-like helix-hairpin-helix protein